MIPLLHALAWALLAILVYGDSEYGKLFIKGSAFSLYPDPTFTVVSPELGRSGAWMSSNYTADGSGRFPGLEWRSPSPYVKEYLLVSEDPDAPLSRPIVHGLYYGIPRVFTGLGDEDFQYGTEPYTVSGGFKYGVCRGGGVYLPPSPMPGHGLHRYFFEIIALNERIDTRKLESPVTLDEISHAIEGKVIGWGAWIGLVERK